MDPQIGDNPPCLRPGHYQWYNYRDFLTYHAWDYSYINVCRIGVNGCTPSPGWEPITGSDGSTGFCGLSAYRGYGYDNGSLHYSQTADDSPISRYEVTGCFDGGRCVAEWLRIGGSISCATECSGDTPPSPLESCAAQPMPDIPYARAEGYEDTRYRDMCAGGAPLRQNDFDQKKGMPNAPDIPYLGDLGI